MMEICIKAEGKASSICCSSSFNLGNMKDEELKEAWKGCGVQYHLPEMFNYSTTTIKLSYLNLDRIPDSWVDCFDLL